MGNLTKKYSGHISSQKSKEKYGGGLFLVIFDFSQSFILNKVLHTIFYKLIIVFLNITVK